MKSSRPVAGQNRYSAALALLFLCQGFACAGEFGVGKKEMVPLDDDRWKFTLAVPGWMPGVDGTVGINGIDSDVDVGFDDLVNKVDMLWATRAEASKGRFGVMGELIYQSLSDSLGVGGPLQKIDVRLDQYLADFSLRWRLMEGERGYVDLIGGVRYTNIYQSLHLQSSDTGIGQARANVVDRIDNVLRDRLTDLLSDRDFRSALRGALESQLMQDLEGSLGANPERRQLAIGPLGGREPLRTVMAIEEIIAEEEEQLREEVTALRLQGLARVAEIRRRVAAAKGRLEDRIADALEKNLNRSFARCDDWWDPYVGVRARYNFTPALYVAARGDLGGFGVGSDLMWHAEAAIGVQLTPTIFAEAGYRALSFDYDKGGFTYDTITHGAQVTLGIQF
jgi:hypothetical protein